MSFLSGLFGSDVPDVPDYGDLEDMIKGVYQQSSARSNEQWDFFKNLYNENKPMFDQITDKALGYMDKQYEDYDNYRQRRRGIFEPLEDSLAAEAESYASPERKQYEAGKAEADVASQFQQARQTASDRLEAYGVDPSQTRQGALDLGTRMAEAAAQASAGNQARDKVDALGRQLRSEAIAVGQGYPGYMTQSSQAATNTGQSAANTQLASTASAANTLGTPSTWSSMGSQALGMLGNVMNTKYQNQMAKYEADSAESGGFMDFLGKAAGFATPFLLAEGGIIPDDEDGMYLPPEASPSGGALTDDIPAEIEGGQPAQLNAGEFVIPEDVVSWLGEKGIQQIILKARKEMSGGNGERPAQPEQAPPGPSYEGAGIPMGG